MSPRQSFSFTEIAQGPAFGLGPRNQILAKCIFTQAPNRTNWVASTSGTLQNSNTLLKTQAG